MAKGKNINMTFKNKFKKKFQKILGITLILIAIGIIILIGYFYHAVLIDFEKDCSFCFFSDCMDNNPLCGDFGVYWFKFLILIGIGVFAIGVILMEKEKNGKY